MIFWSFVVVTGDPVVSWIQRHLENLMLGYVVFIFLPPLVQDNGSFNCRPCLYAIVFCCVRDFYNGLKKSEEGEGLVSA